MASPSGAVTFLFTDVEGSTRLWEDHPDEMQVALQAHDEILRKGIDAHGGVVFSTAGDAFAAAFESPRDAIAAAEGAQLALAGNGWPDAASIRVRMGVHTGEAQQRDDDYFGPTLNRAARLMSAAHGGQTVVSSTTRSLVGEDELALRDLGEHRLKDLSASERVWQLIVDGLTSDFPALRTLDEVPGNLPVDPASFIGRHDDIERLMAALEDHRLVTVTGVGGVGKTRLALQVAADASHHYPQGIWFVELAPVRIGDAVPFRFLETMELDAEPGRNPVDTVATAVGEGSVLLLVDNCEHVLDSAGQAIGELLAACPNLKVLASSRRSLGAGGEQVRQVLPLDTSGVTSSATHLFVDRATAAGHEGDLTDRLDVITAICARLDGVPLAIELAAARTRAMSPEDLAARLDERFRLLKGSRSSDADERHKTLLSTIEWSYELLDEDQQRLFDRLGVFAGSFTLTAAEKICADDDLDEFDVVDLVADLVDHSLLAADTSGSSTRYQMMETIREFAAQRLGEDLGVLRDRHAEFHAEWVRGLRARMYTTDEPIAVGELDEGWSDLRAAAVHATGDLSVLTDLLRHLAHDAFHRSRLEVGDWARAGLTVADIDGGSDEDRAVLLAVAATMTALAGDAERAIALGLDLAELSAGSVDVAPDLLLLPAASLILAGDLELCDRLMSAAEERADSSAEEWMTTLVSGNRALVSIYSGKREVAIATAATSAESMPEDYAPGLRGVLGWIEAMLSEAPRAEVVAQMEDVLETTDEVRSPTMRPLYVLYLSSVRAELGDLALPMTEAADNLESMVVTKNLGLVKGQLRRAVVMLINAGRHDPAARLLGWIDSLDHFTPSTGDLLAALDALIPQMNEALGAEATVCADAGEKLSIEEAIDLAIGALRAAAADLT